MSKKRGNNVLVVIVGDYHITGVVSYLEERLPRLATECNARITLFCPGIIADEERAAMMRNAGIRIIAGNIDLDSPIKRRLGLRRLLREVMDESDYDVIHVNTASRLVNLIALSEAINHGIPIRIAHSHSANNTLGLPARIVAPIYRKRIVWRATDILACSEEAGIFLYGKQAWRRHGVLARNGVDSRKYRFSLEKRSAIRSIYHLENSNRVIGFVGRFSKEKNPTFLIHIAERLILLDAGYKFWLVGDGPLLNECKKLAEVLGIMDNVVFFGARNDVADLMQGMDALVMPSYYEGVSLSAIEAQAAGLTCFLSDSISRVVRIPDCNMVFISLNEGPVEWAKTIANSELEVDEDGWLKVEAAGLGLEASMDVLRPYYSSTHSNSKE